ncbi:hypothetical protein AB0880_29605 [Micromonospora chersina]|uniref:hypothetical protein n=1 Tax=Micromonospora chersina TaxID=47854 RepID=UPI0034514EDA
MASRISFDRLPGGPHPPLTPVPPRPARPVFVDATGTRRQRIRRAGVLVALASLGYLPMAGSALLPGPATPLLPGPVPVGGAPSGGATRPSFAAPAAGPTDRRPAPKPTEVVDAPAPAAAQRPAGNVRPAPRRIEPTRVDARPQDPPAKPVPSAPPIPPPDGPTPTATPTPPAQDTTVPTPPGLVPGVVG